MKVILEKDIPNVGRIGQVKEVSDGYARNYLLPLRLAKIATATAMVQARNLDNQKNAESNNRQTRHQADLKKISETVLKFVEKANAEGRLFASVNVAAIVRSIRKQVGVVVDEEDILLDQPIKNIGRQSVSIRIAGQTTQCIIDVQTKP